jgi:hypothetical protein
MKNIFFVFCFLFVFACDEETDRQEVVDKLRTVGVDASPTILTLDPTKKEPVEVNLSAYFLMPKDVLIDTVESFEDESAKFSIPIKITIPKENLFCAEKIDEKYKDLGPLKLCQVKGQLKIPTLMQGFVKNFNGILRIRYGFKVKAKEEEEIVVGDFLVVEKGSESLDWKEPKITIENPLTSGAEVLDKTDKDKEDKEKRFDMIASLIKDDSFEEDVKVGWFVSDGKVKNFRSLETTWSLGEDDKGEYTVLIALYGVRSRFFSFTARKVIIE